MGPIVLFDKSFLQSLSIDESVWFGHFFIPVVCPLFYVETLADLEKAVREGRTPEQEVGIIAAKFPELSGGPCVHHSTLALGDLLGHKAPMNGTIPLGGGREVVVEGKKGIVYDQSPEARAFARWQDGDFLEVEREMARAWRASLAAFELKRLATSIRSLGIDAATCRSINEARALARGLMTGRDRPYERMTLLLETLRISPQYRDEIVRLWTAVPNTPVGEFAPYAAHVSEVDLFFQFALAANLISADRPSNRGDTAYLYYLPFCQVFVSQDRLHERCAPLFLREGQEFVWGEDLKRDLARINTHFMGLPEAQKEQGVMSFAHTPPDFDDSVVCRLHGKYGGSGPEKSPPIEPPRADDPRSKKLIEDLKKWTKAPAAASPVDGEVQMMAIQRKVRRKKGSWFQIGKDVKAKSDERES
jgi:hypothetical protein